MGFIQKILGTLNKDSLKGDIVISVPEPNVFSERDKNELYRKIIVLLNEILIIKANDKIDKVNELAIIMKQTTDKDIFYVSMGELENILTELSEIEQKLKLSQPPSEHLRKFRDTKEKQIALLEKRISTEKKAKTCSQNVTETQTESFDSQVSDHVQENLSTLEAYKMLKRANELLERANKTTDRNEFYDSINEIKEILMKLSQHEKELPLVGSPSADLKKLEQTENQQIRLLEKRIAKEVSDPYKEYYDRINAEKANNLNISFEDVEKYDMKPFDLKKPFISDGNFTIIELEGENLETAKAAMILVNRLLTPYKDLYLKSLPSKITTGYILNQKLPYSYLRLNPYTYSHLDREYPLLLWLSYYGNEYLYKINFDKDGKVGNCDLQIYNYTVQIEKNNYGLYVKRISETLKRPPFGTKTLYSSKTTNTEVHYSNMNENDIERYARECNAYVIREERKEQNNKK